MQPDSIQGRVDQDIQRVGWSVVSIFADPQAAMPCFTYRVGIEEALRFPEVLVFGLPPERARAILNTLGKRIHKRKRPPTGRRLKKLAEGHELVLLPVNAETAAAYMLQADQRYDGQTYRTLQLIWPDPANRLPWDPGFDHRFHMAQPLLHETGGRA